MDGEKKTSEQKRAESEVIVADLIWWLKQQMNSVGMAINNKNNFQFKHHNNNNKREKKELKRNEHLKM